MNYTDQEGCQIENCEDSLEPKGFSQTSSTERVARDRVEARDESVTGIEDNWPRDNNGQIPATQLRSEETSERLMRQRHYEKKAARRRGKQYRKELPNQFDAGESRHEPKLKSMRSKITRKDQRRVPPSRYLSGDFGRRDETLASAMVRKSFERYKWIRANGRRVYALAFTERKINASL